MLVLTRKRDESIMIGDDVKITVVDVRGDQVKLGIEAPRHIPVHREEIYREIQEENRRAALKDTPDLAALEQVLKQPEGVSPAPRAQPRKSPVSKSDAESAPAAGQPDPPEQNR